MAYQTVSKKFTQEEMQDGTAQTWLQSLSIGTIYDVETQQLGNATTLMTVVYSTSSSGGSSSEVKDGRQTVATPGTAVALAASTACKRVTVTAELDNSDIIVVGGSTVIAALSTRRGTPLYPGDSYSLDADDLDEVFIDALTATDGATFTYTV